MALSEPNVFVEHGLEGTKFVYIYKFYYHENSRPTSKLHFLCKDIRRLVRIF